MRYVSCMTSLTPLWCHYLTPDVYPLIPQIFISSYPGYLVPRIFIPSYPGYSSPRTPDISYPGYLSPHTLDVTHDLRRLLYDVTNHFTIILSPYIYHISYIHTHTHTHTHIYIYIYIYIYVNLFLHLQKVYQVYFYLKLILSYTYFN